MEVLERFCRLCLSQDCVVAPLFDDELEDYDFPLYKKVMRCASVKIRWGDGLPSSLCQPCAERINSMWRFREQCEHIDTSLRRFIKQNKKKLNDNWENQIQTIIQDVQSGEVRPRRMQKQVNESSNREAIALDIKVENAEEVENSLRNDILKMETVDNQVEGDGWINSPASPPSPPSPSSPQTPPLNNTKEDGVTSGQKKKRKLDRKRKEYSCEFCGRTFPRSNHLAQHELTHTAVKPFQCSECKKSFWYKASLIGHIKQTHTGDVNYTCELCGKGFFKKTELTRHKPTHSNETPHKCPQCGMGFKIPKTLKRHIRNVHTAQRSHTCHTCGKSFTQLQTLKVHLILHSGVKPYVCSYCGKGFSQSAPLKTHVRIHTGERPYSCHACGDTFSTRSALTAHAFRHSGTLPYPCTRCSATFRLKRDLIQHEQGHDDEESRMGRSGLMQLTAERCSSKEPQQLQPVSTDGQGSALIPIHPIPASHTVGRANPPPPPPPIFHTQQATQQTLQQATQHTLQQAAQQATQQTLQQTAQQATQQVTQQAMHQITQQATQQAAQQVTQQTMHQVTQQVTQQVTHTHHLLQVTQALSQSVVQGVPGVPGIARIAGISGVTGVPHMQSLEQTHPQVHPSDMQTHQTQLESHGSLNSLYQTQL